MYASERIGSYCFNWINVIGDVCKLCIRRTVSRTDSGISGRGNLLRTSALTI